MTATGTRRSRNRRRVATAAPATSAPPRAISAAPDAAIGAVDAVGPVAGNVFGAAVVTAAATLVSANVTEGAGAVDAALTV